MDFSSLERSIDRVVDRLPSFHSALSMCNLTLYYNSNLLLCRKSSPSSTVKNIVQYGTENSYLSENQPFFSLSSVRIRYQNFELLSVNWGKMSGFSVPYCTKNVSFILIFSVIYVYYAEIICTCMFIMSFFLGVLAIFRSVSPCGELIFIIYIQSLPNLFSLGQHIRRSLRLNSRKRSLIILWE